MRLNVNNTQLHVITGRLQGQQLVGRSCRRKKKKMQKGFKRLFLNRPHIDPFHNGTTHANLFKGIPCVFHSGTGQKSVETLDCQRMVRWDLRE